MTMGPTMPESIGRPLLVAISAALLLLASCSPPSETPVPDADAEDAAREDVAADETAGDETAADQATEDGAADPGEEADEVAADEAAGDDGGAEATACEVDADCDDEIECTADSCDPDTRTCRHVPDDALCDDGDACTYGHLCEPAVGCFLRGVTDCDDAVECSHDACNPLTGGCSNVPDHRLCPDPQLCVPGEGGCVAGPPCVDDGDCDDGDLCNGRETCDPAEGCRRGTAADCADDVPCTTDACHPGTGACSHSPDHAFCDDGLYCNGAETCDLASGCAAGAAPACGDGIACTVDRCDATTDRCTSAADNARCDDGRFCNGAETCSVTEGCASGTPPACDDGRACTTDLCSPSAAGGAGACTYASADVDGDTYGDAACTGDDCNDGLASVHPGATETCNGVDDDCDGTTDEGFACARGTVRSCTAGGGCTGAQTCEATCTWGSCVVSGVEACNGVDDDCDGASDETFACVLGSDRSCSAGGCAGTQACTAGCTWGTCAVSATESCNGADDDCDGTTDEGFACVFGRTQACSAGGCAGTQTCAAGCAWGSCVVSAVEACNGVDDDCDTFTDETFDCVPGAGRSCTVLSCAGTQTCAADCTWGSCSVAGSCGSLVINELDYDQPGADYTEFIELYNPTDSAVSCAHLEIWLVNCAAVGGPATYVEDALECSSIASHGYHLIGDAGVLGAVSCAGEQRITGDKIENGSPDAVALVSTATVPIAILDSIVYADEACPGWGEGVPSRRDPDTGDWSLQRVPLGHDTGDNAADFEVRAPTPCRAP